MPELPEVETTRRGIAPYLDGEIIKRLIVRQPSLRWPVPDHLTDTLQSQRVSCVTRRGKYIGVHVKGGAALIHLGMSGSLRVVAEGDEIRKHDHFDLAVGNGHIIRYHDPRRFGCLLWADNPIEQHPLLNGLGPEPLEEEFTADYLHAASRKRRTAIKLFIMNAAVVVGVGNIYASEALFRAGIRPTVQAGRISKARYGLLVDCIRDVLSEAIEQGGSTLRDFVRPDATPGYFAQTLFVYDREGESCQHCGEVIRRKVIGQRSTFYCPICQN